MITFTKWRTVGQALRAARALHGKQLVYRCSSGRTGDRYRKWTVGDDQSPSSPAAPPTAAVTSPCRWVSCSPYLAGRDRAGVGER